MLLRLNLFITRTDVVIPLVCLFLSVALGQKILFHEISIIDGVIFGPSGGMDRIRIPLREIEADGVGRGLFQGMGWTTIRSKSGSRIRLCKYFYRTENWARFTDILMESR